MARDGYLILDSDLHMMGPTICGPATSMGHTGRTCPGSRRPAAAAVREHEDKGNADAIMGMEVAGWPFRPRKAASATASSRELRRRSRARHPHFQVARGQGFDPASTLTAMDIEGVDVAVMYGTRGGRSSCTTISPRLRGRAGPRLQQLGGDYCRSQPQRLKFAAQIAMHHIPRPSTKPGAA